ncbi:MAG: beta-galactosidase, partial [Clostridia bacterium]|nr:beta-galactosidase [Clostridia bacterium]
MKTQIKVHHKPVGKGERLTYSNMESRYGQNTLYFTKDGKPFEIIAGEMHYSRVPRYRWKENLLKMKECGLNAVSTYVLWNYHEEFKNEFDFEGDNDIAAFLATCKEVGMPCILRIGPFCHAEVIYGGMPERINKMENKRTDDPAYLNEVRDYWTRLYREVKPYLDGETVMGIQVENEYRKGTSHLHTLRDLLEEIGYKAPYFTMTAWSVKASLADPHFVAMFGTYPDAPWDKKIGPLEPNDRATIASTKIDVEIGADMNEEAESIDANEDADAFDEMPYASCEVGPGNQVTHHRRPVITPTDGYATGFGRFAAGLNWIGYYMFSGGRNQSHRVLQENKAVGAHNDYAMIDYDFQAPLSRWGVCREHGDRLRLMHLFIKEFDPDIPAKQAFFPKWKSKDPMDISFVKCAVRMGENGCGYFFAGTHEKGLQYETFKDYQVDLLMEDQTISLPAIDILPDSLFFYPFNITLGNTKFDYILAQPIVKEEKDGKTVCYFAECPGVAPACKVNGQILPLNFGVNTVEDVELHVIPAEKALNFHYINGKVYFLDGTVYAENGTVYCETP